MARGRDTPLGPCHLCGGIRPLSFEHVPPRAAFNNQPVIVAAGASMLGCRPGAPVRGRVEQRGAGDRTLCIPCNTTTGHLYGPSFVQWAYHGMQVLAAASGE